MRNIRYLSCLALAVVTSSLLLVISPALASTVDVTVDATAGPWSQAANSSFAYGIGDNTAPTIVAGLTTGESVTIEYVSGLTSGFYGAVPSVDANGYGPANGYDPPPFTSNNVGSSGNYLPGYYTTSPVDVVLMELIGVFTNASGVIVGTPFAIGDGPLSLPDPAGATQLQLGVNDDIYVNGADGSPDNTGSLVIAVSAASIGATPLPATLPLFASGIGMMGLLAQRMKRKNATHAA
jgi:hypothetical protein